MSETNSRPTVVSVAQMLATKKENSQAPMEQDASAAPPCQLGYARGTVSALLTSLKYQVKAKKTSDSEKDDASKVLQDRPVHV